MRDGGWYWALRRRLEESYLRAEDERGGSGFRGDAARWERARRVIVRAVDRDGTFLDVGCANGLLMESVARWAAEEGHAVEPWGVDLSPALAALAARRLPRWAQRIAVGNAVDWVPPRRFDFARTELVYVPDAERRRLVEHLLAAVVAADGRLIVCSYGSATRTRPAVEPVGAILAGWGFDVAGEASAADVNGAVLTRVAWVDASGRRPP
jgi:hypothetical protein